jgi:prepilin signal peptidase PulO-like enzyme (type II secretory pathway)
MDIIGIELFIIGIFLGSFFDCIANRLSKGESIIKPGSHCENCKHKLSWYELIPVFSYIFQGFESLALFLTILYIHYMII